MDSRTIIAFALMILIYIFFFQPPAQQHPNLSTASNVIQATSTPAAVVRAPSIKKEEDSEALRAKLFWLESDKLRVAVDGLGSVREVVFPNYAKEIGKPAAVSNNFNANIFNQTTIDTSLGQPKWTSATGSKDLISIEGSLASGLKVKRTVQLANDNYFLKVTDSFENRTAQSVKTNTSLRIYHQPVPPDTSSFIGKLFKPSAELHETVWSLDGAVSRSLFEGVTTKIEGSGNVSWIGFGDKYFFYGLAPTNISGTSFVIENQGEQGFFESLSLTEKTLEPGKTSDYSYNIYLGPKVLPELKKASPELSEAVDYGSWIGPIARLLLSLLHFFYKIISNYGIGIILLTLLVKLVLYPLAYKSAVSMRKLQVVQPKMKEIRDKYKDDKPRMNAEMMALYRTEKVNPVGGCLPILIQMPVFFALYRVFFHSIEFRHAPFFGWIKDLSVHDHYFVTPVLMTALMWYQTKLTPQPPAMEETEAIQAQRAMMKWMPIIFGAIMIFLPSGLTLYFLVNALLSLLQQLYLNKHLEKQFPLAVKVK